MAKKKINNYVFRPGISFNGNFAPNAFTSIQSNIDFLKKEAAGYINRRVAIDTPLNFFPNAVRLLTDNKNFLINEISAFIAEQVANEIPPFAGYTYDNEKCLRDAGYIVDALIHDVRYGGNEELRIVVANYWINDIPQIGGDRLAEVAAYTFLKDLVVNYVLPGVAATPKQSPIVHAQVIVGPFAEFYTDTKVGDLIDVAIDVIANGLSAVPPIEYKAATFENYTYNSAKCERDLGYILEAYLHDLRYDGNEQTRLTVSKYYDQDTLQVDGSGQAEVETHRFIRTRINDNIITNILGVEEYPNAVRLLTDNKLFLQNEVTAFIDNEVNDAAKCERDIGYLIDGVQYDVVLGTNYNAIFLGLAEYNSLDISDFVVYTIENTKAEIAELSAVASSSIAVSRSNAFFDEVIDIARNGRSAANALTFTNPTSGSALESRIAAKDLLVANKNFIATEINAWVDQVYPDHDHDEAKCTRDINYAIDSLCYDILYGGNSATYDNARFFFYFDEANNPGIDPTHKSQTVAAYGRLKLLVGQIVQNQTVLKSGGNEQQQIIGTTAASAAEAGILQDLCQIFADVVDQGEAALPATKTYPVLGWPSVALLNARTAIQDNRNSIIESVVIFKDYTFNADKCKRDAGYIIDSYIYDLRYGGNEETVQTVTKYFVDGIAQVDGNRRAEVAAHRFLRDHILNYVLTRLPAETEQSPIDFAQNTVAPSSEAGAFNRVSELTNIVITVIENGLIAVPELTFRSVPYQSIASQVVDSSLVPEPTASDKIEELSDILFAVVLGGLSALPTLQPASYGIIKFQSKASSTDLLLITNTTSNQVIYNFTNAATGGLVTYETEVDSDFTKFLQTTDAVTIIHLYADTSAMSEDDDIQIFVETPELAVRPFDFGTDAIERMRVAAPQAMLDADFEYGLQPTKWQAIATLRGYPSIFEVPGTDLDVINVVTDASAGTDGIGGSLITVTTAAPHGFSIGTPVTIRGLDPAIPGARAEGSFVIVSVPTNRSFTYYAKAKTGNTDGEQIQTTYTQIRQGGFYTGAEIGTPTFSILSNGSNGLFTSKFITPTSTNRIAFTGTAPEIGAPVVGTGINPGTQITAVVGSGGIVTTPVVVGDYLLGSSSIELQDTSGVVAGLAFDSGNETVTAITSIDGSNILFTRPLTATVRGNIASYSSLSSTSLTGQGVSALLSVAKGDTTAYISTAVTSAGYGYAVGDSLRVLGSDLGGSSPANDLIVTVTGVNIDTVPVLGDYSVNGGFGTGLTVSVIRNNVNGAYSVFVDNGGINYQISDTFTILGTLLGGTSPLHDITLSIAGITTPDGTITDLTTVGSGISGLLTSVDVTSGVANPTANQTITDVNNTVYSTNTVSGVDAVFTVSRTGSVYNATVTNTGTDYLVGELFTILGTEFTGGLTPANDLTITISTVFRSYIGVIQDSTSGSGVGATFSVSRTGDVYSVTMTDPGVSYAPAETITVLGSALGGIDVDNDLTVTIGTVGSLGEILTFTFSGTAAGVGSISAVSVSGTGNNLQTYTGLTPLNVAAPGTGAIFSVTRSLGTYSSVIITNGGLNYRSGNRLLIAGSALGGLLTTNDLILTVNSVEPLTGEIIGVTVSPSAVAASGVELDLYSAVTIGEVTVGVVPDSTTITYSSLATLRIDFAAPHGIIPGGSFIVTPSSDNGVNNHVIAGGSYSATSVPTETSLTYQVRAPGLISGTVTGKVYARPDSFFSHRPFDGGVQLGTGGPQHGAQAIRQSKKYIRYQSGKGAMYTTGALFAPSYDIQYIEATGIEVGSVITIFLDENDHGLQVGAEVRLTGVSTAGYNGDYVVDEVTTERVFKIIATRRLGSKIPVLDFSCQVSTLKWQGAVVRAGVFDDQNGIFWEYDGNELAVVQRTSTRQLAGTISIDPASTIVTGSNTRFRDQVKSGDAVVIRGMTHIITKVTSQTSMNVAPDFRGVNPVVGAKICLVSDKRVPQREFNLDRLDGTGGSGYDLDITKMQMIGIQFSWYGAGFIDFMLRGSNGNFVFAHRMRNSNINTEAFMRTGNLPVRYEVSNYGANARLMTNTTNTSTSLMLDDASAFPETGIVYVDNELIAYSGKTGNTLTGCTRSATLTNFQSGATRSYTAGIADSHLERTGVVLVSNTCTPLISHWGSAFLIDGQFDEDRGYIFSYTSTGNSITTTKKTVFLIRLAPSVSNAVVGDLGDRELLNRAQLLLNQISITSDTGTGGIVIEGVINPQNYPANPGDISWGRLSGLAQGGQPSFAQIAPGGSVNWNSGASITTSTATTLSTLSGTVTVPTGTAFNRPSGSTIFYSTRTSWDSLGAEVGQIIADAKFPGGTTITARTDSPAPTAIALSTLNGSARVPNNGSFNRPSGNNVLFILRSSWEALAGNTTVTDIRVNDFRYPAGTTVLVATGPQSFGGIQYYTLTLSQNSLQFIGQNSIIGFEFAGQRLEGSTKVWFTQTSWSALPVDIVTGQTTDDPKFNTGTQISSVSAIRSFAGVGYFEVNFNQGSTSVISAGGTVTFNTTLYYTITVNRAAISAVNGGATVTLSLPAPATTTSFLYFGKTSWDSSGAAANTEVAPSDVKFPANTRVLSVSSLKSFAGTEYYQVSFTQSSTTTIAGGSTVTFQFGQPAYALPGETVFSFITNPGASDSLVLNELKELTTTSLGGRGTFPNGPDVLAINVYKVAGAAVNANIILRWSEAQA